MDDDFDSPDSDGHASIPSPTETSFNISNALQNARVWPPESSASQSSGDEVDESPIVVFRRRNSKKSKRVLPSILGSSPDAKTPSRVVLRPTNSNDSPQSTPKTTRSKRSSENKSPHLDMNSEEDDDIVQSDERRYDGGDESDSSIVVPSTSEASTPHPESTPDALTGLSKRVAVRRPRDSPAKHQSPTRKSGSPSTPANRFFGGQQGSSSDNGEEDTMLPEPSQGSEGQETKQTASGDSTPLDHAQGTGAMLPPDTPESLEDRPQMQNQARTVSQVSTASVMRNEIFEEIDASVLMEKMSQALVPVQSGRPTPRRVSFGNLEIPDTSDESATESMGKISGNSSDSAIPQTPPNRNIPRRKYIQTNVVPSNFSFKRNTISSSTPPITPNKGMFALGTKPSNKGKEAPLAAPPSSLPGAGRPTASPEVPASEAATEGHNVSPLKTADARRVSMSTPPSMSSISTTDTEALRKELPSPLPSDFTVSPEQLPGRPHSAADVIADEQTFKDNPRPVGTQPPPNSTINTPDDQNSTQPSLGNENGRLGERSKSNPLDSVPGAIQRSDKPPRQLFDVDRVEKVGDVAPGSARNNGETDLQEGPSTIGDTSSSDTASDATPKLRTLEIRNSRPDSSEDEGERTSKNTKKNRDSMGGHAWSGFSETFRSTTPSYEPGQTTMQDKDIEDMSSSQFHMASSSHDGSLRLGDVEVRVQTPNSVRGDESELHDDPESMRRHIFELRQTLNQASKKDEEQREKIRELSDTVTQYEEEYGAVHSDVELHRQRVRFLEKQVAELQAHQKGLEGSPATPQVRKYTLRIAELQAKIDSLETARNEQVEIREQENEEHENTIRHLRAALDQRVNSTINEPLQKRIVELENQLQLERKAGKEKVSNTEKKYKELLAEQDGMINHLQAELDEYANVMPVDPGDRTSRIFDADDAGDAGGWMDERSQDMSQFFEDSLDHILTQIGGMTEIENFDEAAEEAEKSLRYLASNAGHDGLSRAELAAFGIQNLKDENTTYKSLHARSEQRVNDLSQANESLGKEVESLKSKAEQLNAQNAALQKEISEGHAAVERVEEEVTQLEQRLKENARALEKALAENEKSLRLDERVRNLEAQLAALEQSYVQAQKELERWKAQTAEAEKKVKEQQERLVQNQKQLRESDGYLAEVEAYKQRTSELLKELAIVEKSNNDRVMRLEQQIEDLETAKITLTKERDVARESASHVGETSTTIQGLEKRIAAADERLEKLQTEKAALEASTLKAETEATQARSRFNVLLHESAEKDSIWNGVKSTLQAELEQKTRELHHAVEPYIKGLQRIAAEVDEYAPEREGDKQLFDLLRAELLAEGVAEMDTVAGIIVGLRALDVLIDGLDGQQNVLQEKNQRLKAAIKRWGLEHTKEKSKVEGLKKQVNELTLRLKAEKKQSDEKIGQLILALRR